MVLVCLLILFNGVSAQGLSAEKRIRQCSSQPPGGAGVRVHCHRFHVEALT